MQTDAWIGRAILMCTLQGCECIQKDIGTVSANLQPFFWGNVDPKMAIGRWGGILDTSKMIIRNIVLFLILIFFLIHGATGSDEPWAGSAAAAGSLSRLHQTVLG
jgi:hypothetical protein